ncbi:MAG: peroxidase-related enzyme [Balneolaceae bacterium]|nr:peroxidase-related enzyme [Balneolaceae bacterium]
MAYIKVIDREEAEGRLREIYDDLVEKRGKLAEVHKIQSLNPESIVKHMDLYLTVMFGKSPLKRAQREMLGVVVSVANRCEYCQLHHGTALNHYWKNEERLKRLRRNYSDADLSAEDELLCDYAWHLTTEPEKSGKGVYVERLRSAGFGDRAILDATLVISYFNFVNRVVLGLGVKSEGEEAEGYSYD